MVLLPRFDDWDTVATVLRACGGLRCLTGDDLRLSFFVKASNQACTKPPVDYLEQQAPRSAVLLSYGQSAPGAGAGAVSTWLVCSSSAALSRLRHSLATMNNVFLS